MMINLILGCANNSVYSEPEGGLISSPNYPGSYLDNLNCTYLIDLRASADNVRLQFLDFQTDRNNDYVAVLIYFSPLLSLSRCIVELNIYFYNCDSYSL